MEPLDNRLVPRAKWIVFVIAVLLIGAAVMVVPDACMAVRTKRATVTVANASMREITAQCLQSSKNTWHTPVAGDPIVIAPGGEQRFGVFVGDQVVIGRTQTPGENAERPHKVAGNQRLEVRDDRTVVSEVE